ncbi:NUDIX hydrolase [Halobacillus locisalis]|uniref:NUDIX hydrolase n=1 Tax=Halobacillus locisalis TaxID=220753 RepID=A0A838CRZ0_9BACI|nr:NUDIX hydrolase [Halobacillus locisalis]MBA2174790.1 NUDIX hydrolase [Halobacillus locisalis]
MDIRFQLGKTRFNYRSAGILIQNDHVLLHRHKDDSYWALPGGGVEIGESTKESVVREWKEELAVEIKVKSTAFIVEQFFTYRDRPMHELGFYYNMTTPTSLFQKGRFHGMEGDHLIYQWLPLDEIEEYDIRPAFLRDRLRKLPEETEHLIFT